VSDEYSIRIVDNLSKRYVVCFNKDHAIAWDIDSETQITTQLPTNSDIVDVIPFFKERKIGILGFENKENYFVLKYKIMHLGNEHYVEKFDSSSDYFSHNLVKYDNQDCLFLIKEDRTFDIRTLDKWSLLQHDKNEKLPDHSQDNFDLWTIQHVTEQFYINAGRLPKYSGVKVWSFNECKYVSSFSGISPDLCGMAVDKSGTFGIFYTVTDSLSQSGEIKKKYSIQVQSLYSGKILSQLIYERMPSGMKFSPIDSQLILIWDNLDRDAILWKQASQSESGKIVTKIKLSHSLSHAQKLHLKNIKQQKQKTRQTNNCNNNDHLYFIGATFSSDGKKIVFLTNNMQAIIYSTETGKFIKSISIGQHYTEAGMGGRLRP
jgi:hypothetical protein